MSCKICAKRHWLRLVSLLTALLTACLLSVAAQAANEPWSGAGTASNPYRITDADGLLALAESVNTGSTWAESVFKLEKDLDLSGICGANIGGSAVSWEPIGSSANLPFAGEFDGGGKTVSGLYIESNWNYIGLFGYATGTIRSLNVEGAVSGYEFVGGVAGCSVGKLSQCTFSGTVSGTKCVGGIVGCAGPESLVQSCSSDAAVNGKGSAIGGIVGWANGVPSHSVLSYAEVSKNMISGGGTVTDCTFSGTLTLGDGIAPGSYEYDEERKVITFTSDCGSHGGIVGFCNSFVVSSCVNTGTVNGIDNVGGVVGRLDNGSALRESVNRGTVTGKGLCVGGVTGLCFRKSTVVSGANEGTVSAAGFVGGVIGIITKDCRLSDCNARSTASVTSADDYAGGVVSLCTVPIESCSNAGAVNGGDCTGGVAGYAATTLSFCTNTGAVSGENYTGGVVGNTRGRTFACVNESTVSGGIYVGGVAGVAKLGVGACENKASAEVQGTENVGGIAGSVKENGAETSVNSGKVMGSGAVGGVVGWCFGNIRKCTNAGAVGAIEAVAAGGIAGVSANGAITDCENTGAVESKNLTGGIAGTIGYGSLSDYRNSTERENPSSIQNCKNSGKITAWLECAGGIAGIGAGDITGCSNSGDVFSPVDAGGILGVLGYSASAKLHAAIKDCVNNGAVSGKLYTGGVIGSVFRVGHADNCSNYGEITSEEGGGGVVGRILGGRTTNCVNYAKVNGTNSRTGGVVGVIEGESSVLSACVNNGEVNGLLWCGGVVGQNGDTKASDTEKHKGGLIENCNNYGAVNATGDSKGQAQSGGVVGSNNGTLVGCTNHADLTGKGGYLGGVLGLCEENGTVKQCSNTASITGAFTASADSDNPTGGVVAYSRGEIVDCTNLGKVTGGGGACTGGIAGAADNGGKITDCTNEAEVVGNEDTGGIVGRAYTASIKTCKNTAKVQGGADTGGIVGNLEKGGVVEKCTNSGVTAGGNRTGGIVGGSNSMDYEAYVVRNCENAGATVSGGSYTGGVIGRQGNGTVEECVNRAAVSGSGKVGGIAGMAELSLKRCVNHGSVSSSSSSAGGVAGQSSDSISTVISYCENHGAVSAPNSGDVGGIMGRLLRQATCSYCVNYGNVTGGGKQVGGVAGSNYGTVSNCANSGDVYSTNVALGGVVGDNDAGTVKDSVNRGKVTAKKGVNQIGGIVGGNEDGGAITGCTNTGSIGSDVDNNNRFVGGVVGSCLGGSVTDCKNTGTIKGADGVGGIIGLIMEASVTFKRNLNDADIFSGGDISDSNAGGLVGWVSGVEQTIDYSANKGGIVKGTGHGVGGLVGYLNRGGLLVDCYNRARVYGNTCVGGAVGYINDPANTTLRRCVIFAPDKGEDGSGNGVDCIGRDTDTSNRVGGVVGATNGYTHPTFKNCYWYWYCAAYEQGYTSVLSGGAPGVTGFKQEKTFKDLSEFHGEGYYDEYWKEGKTCIIFKWEPDEVISVPSKKDDGKDKTNNQSAGSDGNTDADPGGEGSDDAGIDLLYINTVDELLALRQMMSGYDPVSGNFGTPETFANVRIVLRANLTLSETWSPLGTESEPFCGIFDGAGHVISGLDTTGDNSTEIGLFGAISPDAVVKDLVVSGTVNGPTAADAAGGIVGVNKGTVENCIFLGGVTAAGEAAGGVAGRNEGTVLNCIHADGTVSTNASKAGAQNYCAGGVAGVNRGKIENCFHYDGAVNAAKSGGAVGCSDGGSVKNCAYTSGDATLAVSLSENGAALSNLSSLEKDAFTIDTNFNAWTNYAEDWGMGARYPLQRSISTGVVLDANNDTGATRDFFTLTYASTLPTGDKVFSGANSSCFYRWTDNKEGSGKGFAADTLVLLNEGSTLYAQWAEGGGNALHQYTDITLSPGSEACSALFDADEYQSGVTLAEGAYIEFYTGDYIQLERVGVSVNADRIPAVTLEGRASRADAWTVLACETDYELSKKTETKTTFAIPEERISDMCYFRVSFNGELGELELFDRKARGAVVQYEPGGADSGTAKAQSGCKIGKSCSALGAQDVLFSRVGYQLAGWNTEPNGSGEACGLGASFTVREDTVLYAQWTPQKWTIDFKSEDGTKLLASYSVDAGKLPVYKGEVPTKTDPNGEKAYVFNGWSPAPEPVKAAGEYLATFRELVGAFDVQIAKKTYTGSALTPSVTASYHGTPLTAGTDFFISGYRNAAGQPVTEMVDAGDYTVVIKGRGAYSAATVEQTFTIEKGAWTDKTASTAVRRGNSGTLDLSALVAPGGKAQVKSLSSVYIVSADTSAGVYNPGADTVSLSFTAANDAPQGAATVTVSVTGAKNHADYDITVTITVTDKELQSLAFADGTVKKTWGDAAFMTQTPTGAQTGLSYKSGNPAVATVDAAGNITITGAGTAIITASAAETAQYAAASASYTLEVARRPVTVRADDKSKLVGAADPVLTATVTGLLGSDTVQYGLTRAEGETEGEYAITPSGATQQGNYAVSYLSGKMTIRATELHDIDGDVASGHDGPILLELFRGKDKIGETRPDANGRFLFAGNPNGIYNLVATQLTSSAKGDIELKKTSAVIIAGSSVSLTIKMPETLVSSELEVEVEEPVVVGGIDKMADQVGVGDDDVEAIGMTIDEIRAEDAGIVVQAVNEAPDGATNVNTLASFDIGLYYTRFSEPGVKHGIYDIGADTSSNVFMEIILPVTDPNVDSFRVLRKHNGVTEAIGKLDFTARPQEGAVTAEGYVFDASTRMLYIYLNKFSSLTVVQYTAPVANNGGGGGGSGGSSSGAYTPNIAQTLNGTIVISPTNPRPGDTVTITARPDAGYLLDELRVRGADGRRLPLTENADGTFAFVLPEEKVTINGTFAVNRLKDFRDLKESAWYARGVQFALTHEIMKGMGGDRFEPDTVTSRAMVVQMLYNLDGAPAGAARTSYNDVDDGAWYVNAIDWAAQNHIANGTGKGFGPDNSVTREQFAVMLYNFAKYKGFAVNESGSLSDFPDSGSVSSYAREALAWAIGAGLINGTTDESGSVVLDAQGTATRAQIAVMLQRFCDKFAE